MMAAAQEQPVIEKMLTRWAERIGRARSLRQD
jgi:hypothetical protein